MDLVSVIVPIFNVEKYIYDCVMSIVNQDYKALEIILVNDGSNDNSLSIIEKIANEDTRIKIINKENGGVSSARNCGLEICKGKYIIFVDGDDYLELNYVSYYVNLMNEFDGDMAISYNCFGENYKCVVDRKDCILPQTAMEELYLNKINVAVWNKIYKKELIVKNNLKFNEQFWFAEGMTFNIEYFQCCKKIVTCYALLYHQVENPDSAVRKFRLESWHCGLRAMVYQKENWIVSSHRIQDAWTYHYRCYNRSIWLGLIRSGQDVTHYDEIVACKKGFKHGLLSCMRTNISIKNKIKCILEFIWPDYLYNRKRVLMKGRIN